MFYLFDILGTFIFAITGALKAVKYELDILGIMVLSVIVGVGGGITRDLILGYNPPNVFRDETYFFVCIVAGIITFLFSHLIEKKMKVIVVLDAIGLGVFAAIGAIKAEKFGLGPIGISMMAVTTATGGGVIRDLLVKEIPFILKRDFYASAALLGGIVYLITTYFQVSQLSQILLTTFTTTLLRLIAFFFDFQLPTAKKFIR